jgi:hypothetical protein
MEWRDQCLSAAWNLAGYPEPVALLTMRFVFLPPRLGSGVRGMLV